MLTNIDGMKVMRVLEATTRRVTETPNAVMTTLASPTLGQTESSVWLVKMRSGVEGPVHAFDSELVWVITDGDGLLRHEDHETVVRAGDTLVLPAGRMRQLIGGADGFDAIVVGRGGSSVTRADGDSAETPPWVA